MESLQNLKKRIKSVSNVGQITKAMELVAATKMRKSQQIALDSRPYAFAALDFLATISSLENQKMPPLFEVRKSIKKVLFVLVSSDKGLAGAFNSSVFKKFEKHIKEDKKHENEEKVFAAVGEKSFNYLVKRGFKVLKKFVEAGDYTTPEQVRPLFDFLIKGYLNKDFDRVIIVSTHFRSALKQEPHVRRVLPIDYNHIADTIKQIIPERGKFADLIKEHNITFTLDKKKLKEYTIEPEPEKVLEKLAEHLFFMQIYHLILEANASEHSARRMAMKTASDNASDLGNKLNLQYNKSRQARITTEIAEISAGAEAQS
ncbi:MAG: ATP synthase F1 subunit gamma [Candidatus Staskawiczbacteria bacterium RIFCSPHIGHO2_01_FULL_36_16]|uniref:ATP synthase gamma chain n=2 Tax=Candidatus Staskawicziibacteriota TaxID=1817916 RepID=A0A1G2HU83_9BACT|nr:MAG: ATP synthase F1 subunit gamma [Candidatus Staskawiczbacteria bacterium RIFCSPHIGHO2_01_FULL_36_16]